MFKSRQSNNGYRYHNDSGKFIKNVFIGMFYPTPATSEQVKQTHNSAVDTHNKAMELHNETMQKIEKTEQLMQKYTIS